MRRLVAMATVDVHAVVSRESCGVSCPFCRHVVETNALPRSECVDQLVRSAVEAIQQCHYEVHPNTMDETATWVDGHWSTACIERRIADLRDNIDDVCRGIQRFEQELLQLRARYAAETDRQSRELIREQLDLASQNVEWEWCQVGHLEYLVDDELAAYEAHVNVMQLQTNERTTVVSDLFQSIGGDAGGVESVESVESVDRCTDAELHAWDKLTSPIGFFTFLPQRMQYMHRQRDLPEFVRYLQGWFALRNELMFLVDDVRQIHRQASGTGIRRWLWRHPTDATRVSCELVDNFHARIRRCVETKTNGSKRNCHVKTKLNS